MKLNLKNVKVFTSLDKTQYGIFDARKELSSIIYQFGTGQLGYILSKKLYEMESDEMEFEDQELQYLLDIIKKFCPIAFGEAIELQINEQINEQSNQPQEEKPYEGERNFFGGVITI